MTIKIGINGFGRIGRNVLRSAIQNFSDIEVVAINDLLEPDYLAYMLQYDSVHGRFKGTVKVEGGNIVVNGKTIRLTQERDPANLEWNEVGADIVIESATESEDVKRKIFADLCPHLREDALIATNTSSISITRLAASTDRPERFMGVHFMNPVPVMELVELVRGIATDDATFDAMQDFASSLGKKIANAEDFPAFIVNRILLPMINEAVYTLYEGVGSVESIDKAMKLGANHPMGPLQLADFIGLDTCLSIMQVLYDGLADSKYRPCPLLVKYVEAGWLGRKTQRGFYDYRGEKPVPTR